MNGEITLDEDDWETAKNIANDLRAAGYDAASAAEMGDNESAANVIDGKKGQVYSKYRAYEAYLSTRVIILKINNGFTSHLSLHLLFL